MGSKVNLAEFHLTAFLHGCRGHREREREAMSNWQIQIRGRVMGEEAGSNRPTEIAAEKK